MGDASSPILSSRGTTEPNNSAKNSSAHSFFQPAEHLPHSRTLTAFPNLPGCYQDEQSTSRSRSEVISISRGISEFEPVWLYVHPEHIDTAKSLLDSTPKSKFPVTIKEAEVDNLWIRDLGPVFLHSSSTGKTEAAIDFNFNYWGHKAEETVDDTFARRILSSKSDYPDVTRLQAGIVSEGGALEVDGDGTLLVTDTSVINDNRNPGKTKEEIEMELKRVLGVSKVVWLKGVKDLESTDWHVDAWCRFVRPGEVLLSKPPKNAHKEILEIYDDALERLGRETDAKGRKFKVHIVAEPDQDALPGWKIDGLGMVTAYVNYLLVNGGVVMAKFGDEETDKKAFEIVKSLFPERKVVQVFINELPRLGGGIHCASQHIPL